jgi:phenylacetate-CoA ligase
MPIIRYDIGDYVEAGELCDCGRGLPVLNQIMGRTRHLFTLPDGRSVWPSLGSRLFARFPEIRQRQLIQQKDLSVDIRLVVSTPLTSVDEHALKTELEKIMGHPLTLNIRYVDEIPRAPGGKFEDFISLVEA